MEFSFDRRGLLQYCGILGTDVPKIPQSCTKPSIMSIIMAVLIGKSIPWSITRATLIDLTRVSAGYPAARHGIPRPPAQGGIPHWERIREMRMTPRCCTCRTGLKNSNQQYKNHHGYINDNVQCSVSDENGVTDETQSSASRQSDDHNWGKTGMYICSRLSINTWRSEQNGG